MNASLDKRIQTQLKTWLTAVEIEFEDTTNGLLVTNKEGAKVSLIYGPELTGRSLQKSLDAFAAIQASLGYEPKLPVDRGPPPKRKAHYSRDFELVAMRHSEFRRAPNPPAWKLKAYRPVAEKAAKKFHRKNQMLCQDHLLEVGDLTTYAQLWTVNYIAMYEIDGVHSGENGRFLAQYLGQRFSEFQRHLKKKSRNMLPMLDDAYIAAHGRPYEYTNKNEWFAAENDGPASAWVTAEDPDDEDGPEETAEDRERTRRGAVTYLEAKLASMPHDEMVALLVGAVESDRIHVDARKEASRRLRAHAVSCSGCAGKELPGAMGGGTAPSNVPIRDEQGRVYANVREAARALGVFPSNIRKVLSGTYSHTGHHSFSYVTPSELSSTQQDVQKDEDR